jgi:hypothetical protein
MTGRRVRPRRRWSHTVYILTEDRLRPQIGRRDLFWVAVTLIPLSVLLANPLLITVGGAWW